MLRGQSNMSEFLPVQVLGLLMASHHGQESQGLPLKEVACDIYPQGGGSVVSRENGGREIKGVHGLWPGQGGCHLSG